jgi:hypothetical protein
MIFLASVLGKYLVGHGVANMPGNTNPVPKVLKGIRRKIRVINHIVDGFILTEIEQGTNVIHRPGKNFNRHITIKILGRCDVEKEANIHQA